MAARPPKIPRLDSLLHRLQRAKDEAGKPFPLFDELFFFLDDPPEGTGDRWQKGADLCAEHGIKTSRMSVYRLYRAHVLQWRREQNPPPPATPPTAEEISRLHDEARHLAAQRMLDILNDPGLCPSHLVGLLHSDNRRRQLELARDQFTDRIKFRDLLQHREWVRQVEERAREQAEVKVRNRRMRRILEDVGAIPPDTTP